MQKRELFYWRGGKDENIAALRNGSPRVYRSESVVVQLSCRLRTRRWAQAGFEISFNDAF